MADMRLSEEELQEAMLVAREELRPSEDEPDCRCIGCIRNLALLDLARLVVRRGLYRTSNGSLGCNECGAWIAEGQPDEALVHDPSCTVGLVVRAAQRAGLRDE